MSAQELFVPPPRAPFTIDENDIEIEAPETIEEQAKPPIFARIMPIIMVVLMMGMMMLMFTMMRSRGAMNPMMLMMPVMMMMSMMMMFTGANNDSTGSLNLTRKSYTMALREKRKEVHQHGEALHSVQATSFPNPSTLVDYVGNTDPELPVMWQTGPENRGGLVAFPGSIDEISFSPYMSMRMGTGVSNLMPSITFEPLPITESLEPVTTSAFRNFVRVQAFVPNIPIAFNLMETTAMAIEGNKENVYGLTRAMIMSVAFNHSPNFFRIAIVTDNPESPRWEWAKWLPHCLHPTKSDKSGPARLVFSTMREFAEVCDDATNPFDESKPMYLVVVDKPHTEVRMPQPKQFSSRVNATYIVAAAGRDLIATSKSARFFVDDNRKIEIPGSEAIINGDFVEIYEAEYFARSMARWKPMEITTVEDDGQTVVHQSFKKKNWFEVLGIHDIDEWDPTQNWIANAYDDHIIVPIGYGREGDHITPAIVTLDLAEATVGGDGPHGAGAGRTGSGKSYMIGGVVLGMMALHGPDKVNFILMDFKGGSTFLGYEKMPHVIATISNLEGATDLLERTYDVIEGESTRRQEVFNELGVKDIREYRKVQKNRPDLPPMADLFIVADEFAEFMQNHREYTKLWDSVARVGRSLGMHLFLVSQNIDSSLLGEVKDQLTYGISLAVSSMRVSTEVIGTDRAYALETGKGDSIVNKKSKNETIDMRTFHIEELYVPPLKDEKVVKSTSEFEFIDEGENENTETIEQYSVLNDFLSERQEDGKDEVVEAAAVRPDIDESELRQMKELLMERISLFDKIKAPKLWQKPLRVPSTFQDMMPQNRTEVYPNLVFDIGIKDVPRKHSLIPFSIRPSESSQYHIFISGDPDAGKTTALQTIIASAARSYLPSQVQFMVMAWDGAEIRAIEKYPHVVAVGGRTDDDIIERYLGEAIRIIRVRNQNMKNLGSHSIQEYLKEKQKNPAPGDKYGHVFLAIDGIGRLRTGLSDEEKEVFDEKMRFILNQGSDTGVHLLFTGLEKNKDVGYGLASSVPGDIVFRSTQLIELPAEAKEKLRTIGTDQPGTTVDPADLLYYRTVLPFNKKPTPIDHRLGNDIFDPQADYTEDIKEEAAFVRSQFEQAEVEFPPQVKPVPAMFEYKVMWNHVKKNLDKDARTAAMPIGISTEDMHIVDTQKANQSPYLLVFGESGSGKTNTLRVAINNVIQQKSPNEAKFVIFDQTGSLYNEAKSLKELGYLAKYASNAKDFDKAMGKLFEMMNERKPKGDDMSMTRAQLLNRSWYDGPDVYILIDGLKMLERGIERGSNSMKLTELLGTRSDLGCFIIATNNSADADQTLSDFSEKFGKLMSDQGTSILMLSGAAEHGRIRGRRFGPKREGKGVLFTNTEAINIQVAHTQPWGE